MNIAVTTVVTFCSIWTTGTAQNKIDYLRARVPLVIEKLKTKEVPQGSIDLFTVCYEKNLHELRATLDRDCQVERALSEFFGAQVDSSEEEYRHITEYINMCISTEGKNL